MMNFKKVKFVLSRLVEICCDLADFSLMLDLEFVSKAILVEGTVGSDE